ncbi:creatininase family protein [Actinokineospora sp. NBRC 105648]|uniref:creatininase family protein n=1 Tax=Actinokineospora sp. NBRC 105648 TaxID=3032206 RepID=UPI0024A4CC9A|nr:creatininase family protein [Actinokineospora sp. NBRC 105648]GLZ42959.1 creatinine amidohydrolase [Actinokineospora sp. NBRC 105648]
MSDHFADLTSPQVAALHTAIRTTVLLLPVGAVEPHGPHAPLGTDPIISDGMCARVAERLRDDPEVRVLILPAVPYGVTEFGAAFPGAVGVRPSTVHSMVVDIAESLHAQGFAHTMVVNNHFEPAHVNALREAVRTLADRGVRTGYLDLVRRKAAARLTEEFQSGSCHAGRYETSLVLADRPELVDTGIMVGLPALTVDMPGEMAAGHADFPAMGMDRAYCGAPAEATATEGEQTFGTLTDLLVEAVRAQVARD